MLKALQLKLLTTKLVFLTKVPVCRQLRAKVAVTHLLGFFP